MELDQLTEYKHILIENLPNWRDTSSVHAIELKKLTGLTNATYRAINSDAAISEPKVVVIRIFGTVEGLVDKKREHTIFTALGNTGQGPRCLAYGGAWRIEEFIDQGVHPDLVAMRDPQYRRLIAKYLSQFHKIHLSDVPQEDAVMQKYLANPAETFKPFWDKVKQADSLFNESEREILTEFKELVSEDQVKYLRSILPTSSTQLCHNDLNNLNIFYSVKANAGSRVKFIDFEYCGYNYVAFDIANFMNESHFNYSVTEDPFYEIVKPNVFSKDDIIDFVRHYVIAKHIESPELLANFEDDISQGNENAVNEYMGLIALEKEAFEAECNALMIEVLSCQILSNWYWVIWSVITAKAPGMLFNHLHYGKARFEIFKTLKQELCEFLGQTAN